MDFKKILPLFLLLTHPLLAHEASRNPAQTSLSAPTSTARPYCGIQAPDMACRNTATTARTSNFLRTTSQSAAKSNFISATGINSLYPGEAEILFSSQVLDLIIERSAALQLRWRNFYSHSFEAENFDLFELNSRAISRLISSYSGRNGIAINRMLEIVEFITSEIASEAVSDMREVTGYNFFIAAAYWWSARFYQLGFACVNDRVRTESRQPVPNATNLILVQRGHQDCRRDLIATPARTLDTASASPDNRSRAQEHTILFNVRFDSAAWRQYYALASRKERAQTIINITNIVIEHANQRNIPPLPDAIRFLAHSLIETHKELRIRKVITWTGLAPMDAEDRTLLNREKEAIGRAIAATINAAITRDIMSIRRTLGEEYPKISRIFSRSQLESFGARIRDADFL